MLHSELLNTLQNLINKKPTQQELANILEINIGTISARAVRNSKYFDEELEKLEKYYNCAIRQHNLVEKLANDYAHYKIQKMNEADDFQADYYPDVFGSCGNGVFVLSETKEKMSVPKRIVKHYSNSKKYFVITAYGDSMMPYIQNKDLLVVEYLKFGEQIQDNQIYVFCIDDKVFVKRLALNINQLIIKSDNKEFDTIKLNLKEEVNINVVGKIVGLMRITE